MKKNPIVLFIPAVIVLLFAFIAADDYYETLPKNDIVKATVIGGLSKYHFQNQELNDEFSAKAFDTYIKRIDPNKRFLLKSDFEELSKYRNQIDNELRGEPNPLYDKTVDFLAQRMVQIEGYVDEILDEPFDFNLKETIELDGKKREYASSLTEMREEWRKYIKSLALVRYSQKMEEIERKKKEADEKGETYSPKTATEIEQEVRADVRKNIENRFDLLSKVDEDDRFAEYVNAMTSVFGPHTEFFPPEEKENFDIRMSGRLEGIGASLTQSYGEISVARIVPGSASWKQGELKAGDIILKVAQGDDEPVPVIDLPLKDAVKLIRGPKGTEVKLTIKKADGVIDVVSIIRDEVVIAESYAKSAVVETEDGSKYGLIDLPSFYADFNKRDGRFSSEDVKTELIKLKSHDVDGIVLDLRNNGGGSLGDAIKMSGYFIEDGPVVQVRSSVGPQNVYDDQDDDIVWDGPLVVLVSEFSASASEILAAALQDYNRAIIVGSERTFGKGTVQRFIDLDQINRGAKDLGSLKLTIQKFYRINGGATQEKGVEPDIVLPSIYSELEIGEANLDFVMPWDQISPADYELFNPNLDKTIDVLAKRSDKRIKKNEVFQKIAENASRLKEQQDLTLQTLNLEEFNAEQKTLREESKKYSDLTKQADYKNVQVLVDQANGQDSRLDSILVAGADVWKKDIQKDVYLKESFDILADYEEVAGKDGQIGYIQDK